MPKRRWIAGFVVALLLAFVAFAAKREVSLIAPDRAAALLVAVEHAAALPVRDAGPLERTAADGPMPDMADRRLTIAADAATITTRLLAGCTSQGLSPASPARRAIEPDALCTGNDTSIHLTLRCDATCTAHLQARVN